MDVSGALHEPTGVGRYTSSLAAALEGRVDLVRFGVSLRAPHVDGVRRWRLPAHVVQQTWRRTGSPSPAWLYDGAQIVHGANFVLPPLKGRAGVATVHDLWFMKDEEAAPVRHLRELVPWTLQRAAAVITPTRASAEEVESGFGFPSDRIFVTHLGVDPVFVDAIPLPTERLAALGVRPPFALAVATLQPRKNLPRFLEAWRAVHATASDWTLALVGKEGWGPEMPEVPGVVRLGYQDDSTLPGLMAAADLFCFPSIEEGFGLPPLEAMAAGTPVFAGSYPAAREVLGDAAELADPMDVDELAAVLARLLADARARDALAQRGRTHAAAFTWDATAQATVDCYSAVLS